MRSTGFYQTKTRNLIAMAQALVDRFDGEVPTAREDLVTLAGVGRKTANVVRSVAFGLPGLPVDTHVGRLALRLGLTTEDDPVKVEAELCAMLPPAAVGRLQPARDPARPAGVRRQEATLRGMRPGGHLPVVTAPTETSRTLSSQYDAAGEHLPCQRTRCMMIGQPGSRHLVCERCWDPPPGVAGRRPLKGPFPHFRTISGDGTVDPRGVRPWS